MQQLIPPVPHGQVTALEALADGPTAAGRPAVRLCMVQSLDGVTAVDGTSGALSSDADRAFYVACRSLADTVLVGAQTVRSEGYGPARLTPQLVVARLERGQPDLPRIAVVSRTLALDFDGPLFTEARQRTIVVTCEAAPANLRAKAATMAEVVVAGDDAVDLATALSALNRDGCRLVGCEGGPTLNAQLLDAGLVDEVCLSISPQLVGDGPRLTSSLRHPHPMRLHALLREGDGLFMRLRPQREMP